MKTDRTMTFLTHGRGKWQYIMGASALKHKTLTKNNVVQITDHKLLWGNHLLSLSPQGLNSIVDITHSQKY